MQIQINEKFKNTLPPLSEDEFSKLEQNVLEFGVREPLSVWRGILIDGHNRYNIATKHNIDFSTVDYTHKFSDEIDVILWIVKNQGGRRNVDKKFILAELMKYESEIAEKAKEKQIRKPIEMHNSVSAPVRKQTEEVKPIHTSKILADLAGVSSRTVESFQKIKKSLPEEDYKAWVEDKDVSIKAKEQEVRKEERKQEQKAKVEEIKAKEVLPCNGVYDVIVLDPPWQMEKIERDVAPNQVGFDYPTMNEEELEQLEIPMADDCHIWVWTTHKHLPMALRLIEKWGMKYVCTFVWHKNGGFQPFGLPQYNCEFAIYARKGTPQFIDLKAFPTCFSANRKSHSEKPEEFYDIVRRVTAGHRLDMFNRRKIDGFDVWGNES